jgi:hypothetical protein
MLTSTFARAAVVAALVILLLVGLQIRSCVMASQQQAQSKVDRGQAGAARESAGDALNTQAGVHSNDMAAADLDRTNGEEIRNAKGSDQSVDPAAGAAGRNSLCRRAAYRNRPECRVQQPDPSGVAPAR